MIKQTLNLTTKDGLKFGTPILDMMQGDTGREIECTFADFEIPVGSTACVYVSRPNSTFYTIPATINDQKVLFDATQAITTYGVVNCNLEIAKDGEKIQSFPFNIRVTATEAGSPQTEENGVSVAELDERVTALENTPALHTYIEDEVEGGFYDITIGGEEANSLTVGVPTTFSDETEFEHSIQTKAFSARNGGVGLDVNYTGVSIDLEEGTTATINNEIIATQDWADGWIDGVLDEYATKDWVTSNVPVSKGISNDSVQSANSTAGAKGWQWSDAGNAGETLRYYFVPIGQIGSIQVGDTISCKAGYSWDYCGVVDQISGSTIYVRLSGNLPIIGEDGATNNWAPENFINSPDGYFWIPSKPNAGNYTIGENATAFGTSNHSNEIGSFSAGRNNEADGRYSVAFGDENKVGYGSLATGKKNKVEGYYSGAVGHTNTVKGGWSFATGSKNNVNRLYSLVCGRNNTSYSDDTFISGYNNVIGLSETKDLATDCAVIGSGNHLKRGAASLVVGVDHVVGTSEWPSGQSIVGGKNNTLASTAPAHLDIVAGENNIVNARSAIVSGKGNTVTGEGSLTIGESNTVSGKHSVSFGDGNTVSGECAVALTRGGTASNHYAITGGRQCTASHVAAVVFGAQCQSSKTYQLVTGLYNADSSTALFIVGNGSNANNRSNAFEVRQNGDVYIQKDAYAGNKKLATEEFVTTRIPTPPTTDGTYTLTCTVSNGTATYSWT